MRKCDELERGCMAKAMPNEMTFVLLGRDAAAPVAIRAWIAERLRQGTNHPADPKIVEAEECARTMEAEQREGPPVVMAPIPPAADVAGRDVPPVEHYTAEEWREKAIVLGMELANAMDAAEAAMEEAINLRAADVAQAERERDEARAECERLRDERDDLADAVDALRRIGHVIGCDHADGAGDRARLVRCVRDELERLVASNARLRAAAEQVSAEAGQRMQGMTHVGILWDTMDALRAALAEEGGDA